MNEWKKVKLGNCIEEVNERTTENNQYEVLTSSKSGIYSQEDYFDKQVASKENTGYKIIKRGQFTYRSMSDNGTFTINRLENKDIGIVSPAYPVFKTKNLNAEYLKYYFQSNDFRKEIYNLSQGSTRTALKYKDLEKVELLLPPIEEQEKIVKILNNADKIIEKIGAYIINVERIKQLALRKCIDEGKMNCQRKKLGDLCKIYGRIGYRGYTVKDIVRKEENGTISLSPGNIVNNKLFLERENTYISNFKYEESPEIKIFNGDIIFVKTGSSYGKVAMVEGLKEKATLNPQLVVLKDIICDSRLLSEILATKYVRKQIDKHISGGIVPTLTQREMESYKIYIPEKKEEQLKLSDYTEKCDEKILKLKDLKIKYYKMKEALMQKLLTGKVRVKI